MMYTYNDDNFHTECLLCVKDSTRLCVCVLCMCKFNPHKNPMQYVILLSLILLLLTYYAIIIYRLSDDVKKFYKEDQ